MTNLLGSTKWRYKMIGLGLILAWSSLAVHLMSELSESHSELEFRAFYYVIHFERAAILMLSGIFSGMNFLMKQLSISSTFSLKRSNIWSRETSKLSTFFPILYQSKVSKMTGTFL